MGSMVIFHYNAKALKDEAAITVMIPNRISQAERKVLFNQLMLDGIYQPAYLIDSEDLDVAFDCGNGYAPTGVNVTVLAQHLPHQHQRRRHRGGERCQEDAHHATRV